MTNPESYKRGQVEWALWRYASYLRNAGTVPPRVFLTRIKRLLEVDRAGRDEPHAFGEVPLDGQGTDAAFTGFDAFCLGLALELLDAGFKQAEVVFLIGHIRDPLRVEFDRIMRNPPPSRQRIRAKASSDLPSYAKGGQRWADFRVFALIRKVEMTEVFPALSRRIEVQSPVILEPVFCSGIEELQAWFNDEGSAFRKTVVLEIASVATLVTTFLKSAPLTKRGRP